MAPPNEVGQALAAMVRGGPDVARAAAAQALGAIARPDPDGEAIDALIQGLLDEDEDVRVDAAEALGQIGHARAGAALMESLVEDPVGEVKVAAVAALGRLKHGPAIPVLRDLVRGRDGRVVWDDEEFLAGGWDDWLDVQVKAIEALGAMAAVEAVPDIVAAAADEMGQDLSPVAFRAVAGMGEAGLAALTAVLRSGRERERKHAAEALRENGSKAARETLAIALADRCAEVRITVLRALAAHSPRDARLGALLADPDPGVRRAAVRLVGDHWPERLEPLFDDPSALVQAEVIDLLGDGGLPPDIEDFEFRLRVKMRGPSERAAVAACQALAALYPGTAEADLREQLRDARCPAPVRRAAARALAKLGTRQAVAALATAAGDDHREVRTEAVAALAGIARAGPAAGAARDVLLDALRGDLVPPPADVPPPPPPPARQKASTPAPDQPWPVSTLQAITGDEPAPAEPEAVTLDERDLELLALTATGPRRKHVPLNPPVVLHQDVRRLAALVLGDVAEARVAEALAAALEDPDLELRRRAAGSLARVGDALRGLPAVARAALRGVLEHRDRDLRLGATRALGTTSLDVVAAVAERLGDEDSHVRAEAVRALAALGATPDAVLDLLGDDDPGVRGAAAAAIAKRGGAVALASLLALAFAYPDTPAAEIAGLLGGLDRGAATARLLATLRDPGQRGGWRIAIDILKELHRPGCDPAFRMVA